MKKQQDCHGATGNSVLDETQAAYWPRLFPGGQDRGRLANVDNIQHCCHNKTRTHEYDNDFLRRSPMSNSENELGFLRSCIVRLIIHLNQSTFWHSPRLAGIADLTYPYTQDAAGRMRSTQSYWQEKIHDN